MINFNECVLNPLSQKTAYEISQWEYDAPYSAYSFKGHSNGYLMNEKTWGTEQFALCYGDVVVGQVACQFDNDELWVGWSLKPQLCGNGNGSIFIRKCIDEIRKTKNYMGKIYLRVAANNKRAIKAYQKSGFMFLKSIQDEVPYTNRLEEFWVMIY